MRCQSRKESGAVYFRLTHEHTHTRNKMQAVVVTDMLLLFKILFQYKAVML